MGEGPRRIKVFPNHFQCPTSDGDSLQSSSSSVSNIRTNIYSRTNSPLQSKQKLKSAAAMLKLFSFRRLPWVTGEDGQEKVILSAAEIASLRSEISAVEEREAYLRAQLEHLDEILRSARLSGYLYIRTRWATLPGEPLPIDDNDVDDWLPRFLVLHGSCIYLYLSSIDNSLATDPTDLSPQDSTLLSDVVELGSLPNLARDDEETRYCFYILTRHGLRYECASASKLQVDSWLGALKSDCKLTSDSMDEGGSRER